MWVILLFLRLKLFNFNSAGIPYSLQDGVLQRVTGSVFDSLNIERGGFGVALTHAVRQTASHVLVVVAADLLLGDIFEESQARHAPLVDVHVLDGRLVGQLVALVHFLLLLELLHAHLDRVDEHLGVRHELLLFDCDFELLVTEANRALRLLNGRFSRGEGFGSQVELGAFLLRNGGLSGGSIFLLDSLYGLVEHLKSLGFLSLRALEGGLHEGVSVSDVVDELAADTVRTVAIGTVLLAELGLVQR